jgi:hypothetical protein
MEPYGTNYNIFINFDICPNIRTLITLFNRLAYSYTIHRSIVPTYPHHLDQSSQEKMDLVHS